MSGRRFDVADVAEVLLLWQAGQSSRQIARRLNMGRDRIRAIVRRAQCAGYGLNSQPLSREQWQQRVPVLFLERAAPTPSRQRQELERFRDVIERGLDTDSGAALWRSLRDEAGLNVSLRTFTRYAREVRGDVDDGSLQKSLSSQLGAARHRIRELEEQLAFHRTAN